MSQIFFGEGLGLQGSSIGSLGGYGPSGESGVGQGGAQMYVNGANGNLVLRQRDGFLSDHNIGINLFQSYNSQGVGYGWMFNTGSRLHRVCGGLNKPGSYVDRLDESGHTSRFVFDAKSKRYLASDGTSARLRYSGGEWHYSKGFGLVAYVYDEQGLLRKKTNTDGLTVHFYYEQGRLKEIKESGGQKIVFDYQGGRLDKVCAYDLAGELVYDVGYGYDEQNRLTRIAKQLGDGHVYEISYGYDGTSERISDIWQTDGTSVHIGYDDKGRVKVISDGEKRTTSYEYQLGKTIVTDASGSTWTYRYDSENRLTGIDGPQNYHIEYRYENNRLSLITQGSHIWRFAYNGQGDCILMSDETGKTIERRYDAEHRLLSETRSFAFVADSKAIKALSDYYIYDDKGHLRYLIESEGVVHAYDYDGFGNRVSRIVYMGVCFDLSGYGKDCSPDLATLNAWAQNHSSGNHEVCSYEYDASGQLRACHRIRLLDDETSGQSTQKLTTGYVYDGAGRLRQEIVHSLDGDIVTNYVYDGLGRLIRKQDNAGHCWETVYEDSLHRIIRHDANGLQTISSYDKSGLILSSHQLDDKTDFGTTTYYYDAAGYLVQTQKPDGHKERYFYDDKGRMTGCLTAQGTLKRYWYDAYDHIIYETTYAGYVNPDLAADKLAELDVISPGECADDRHFERVYDANNQLRYEIDSKGYVVAYCYDGLGRLISKTAYANALINHSPGEPITLQPDVANDRCERYFYDAANNLIGRIDSGGYATEYRYDNRNRCIAVRRFYHAAGQGNSWDMVRPEPNERYDITCHTLYDSCGLKTGCIDGDGYLVEYGYDEAGRLSYEIAYANALSLPVNEQSNIEDLRPKAHDNDHRCDYRYDNLGRLCASKDYKGLETTYTYDESGHILSQSKTDLKTNEIRARAYRYDGLGRLVANLDEAGMALLQQSPDLSDEKIEAIWHEHGVFYDYDLSGHVIKKTNALGQSVRYFYDKANRLAFSLDSDGRLTRRVYNQFGQVVISHRYANAIPQSNYLNTGILHKLCQSLADEQHDVISCYDYNVLGQLIWHKKGQGQTVFDYNGFGETISQTKRVNEHTNNLCEYTYDRRGMLRKKTIGDKLVAHQTAYEYDAFGQQVYRYEAGVCVAQFSYDKRGHIKDYLHARDLERGYGQSFVYDAFGRKTLYFDLDVLAATTCYDDKNGIVTKIDAEDGTIELYHNAFGEATLRIDGNGNEASFRYDAKGALIEKDLGESGVEHFGYDALSRLTFRDTNGTHRIDYTYDASGHLLTKTCDKDGLNLVTTYRYDGAGRKVYHQDASGCERMFAYDASGNLVKVVVDAKGLNLATCYEYDDAGHCLKETSLNPSGPDWVKQYRFDVSGQLIETIIDPGGLSLSERYEYDGMGNLTCKIDAKGQASCYFYNDDKQCRFEVDAKGYVTEHVYDSSGREIKTSAYAKAISLDEKDSDITTKTMASYLCIDKDNDRHTLRSYDGNGRVVAVFDANGYATEYGYDANGNVISKTLYRDAFDNLDDATCLPIPDGYVARTTNYAYDGLNRLIYTVDNDRYHYLSELRYDACGNMIAKIRYKKPLTRNDESKPWDRAEIERCLKKDVKNDEITTYTYDNAGRMIFKCDGSGGVIGYDYDNLGRIVARKAYAEKLAPGTFASLDTITVTAHPSLKSLAPFNAREIATIGFTPLYFMVCR